MQLLFAEEECAQWQWYRSTAATPVEGTGGTVGGKAGHHAGFEAIPGAAMRLYVPTQDDEKHILRVQCTPASMWVTTAIHCDILSYRLPQNWSSLSGNMHTQPACLSC